MFKNLGPEGWNVPLTAEAQRFISLVGHFFIFLEAGTPTLAEMSSEVDWAIPLFNRTPLWMRVCLQSMARGDQV